MFQSMFFNFQLQCLDKNVRDTFWLVLFDFTIMAYMKQQMFYQNASTESDHSLFWSSMCLYIAVSVFVIGHMKGFEQNRGYTRDMVIQVEIRKHKKESLFTKWHFDIFSFIYRNHSVSARFSLFKEIKQF